MLVLSRKLQQQIQIGKDITITVLRVKGQTVRLGIAAPKEVHVLRAELPTFDDEDDDREPPTRGVDGVSLETELTLELTEEHGQREVPLRSLDASNRSPHSDWTSAAL